MEDTVNIDSDSSEENSPIVKKSNPGRRRRGLANRLKISNIVNEPNVISNDAAIYSTRVQKCFENPAGSITLPEIHDHPESDNEVEEVTVTSQKRKSPRLKDGDLCIQNRVCLLDEDDDDEVAVCTPPDTLNQSTASILSPPPPTSPPLPVIRQKKPRMNKDLKKAIKNLADTKEHLYLNDCVQKFQTADDDVICLDDTDSSMTLRISCGTTVYRFKVQPTDPFRNVLPKIATKQKVKENKILLVHNDRTISSSDSPEGLGITSADIVECHIKHGDWSSKDLIDSIDGDNHIKIYVQTSSSRQKLEFSINRINPLDELVRKYCSKTNTEPSNIKLKFDGEDVYLRDTADDLEIEEGYTLDVIHTK